MKKFCPKPGELYFLYREAWASTPWTLHRYRGTDRELSGDIIMNVSNSTNGPFMFIKQYDYRGYTRLVFLTVQGELGEQGFGASFKLRFVKAKGHYRKL